MTDEVVGCGATLQQVMDAPSLASAVQQVKAGAVAKGAAVTLVR